MNEAYRFVRMPGPCFGSRFRICLVPVEETYPNCPDYHLEDGVVAVGEEIHPQEAKAHLRSAGWSYRTAAPALGVTYQHLCYVLNGHRHSLRLLAKVAALPHRKEVES